MRLVRVTMVVDVDAALLSPAEVVEFVKSPEGAHYALDHGQIVSAVAEVVTIPVDARS